MDGRASPATDDRFEVRGPFGGWFVWDASVTEPVLLIGGGSGLVPLMSMLRAGARARLLVSRARARRRALRERAARPDRRDPHLHALGAARLDRLRAPRRPGDAARGVDLPGARVYVCGPTPFVESVANDLVALGHDPATIRTERFG